MVVPLRVSGFNRVFSTLQFVATGPELSQRRTMTCQRLWTGVEKDPERKQMAPRVPIHGRKNGEGCQRKRGARNDGMRSWNLVVMVSIGSAAVVAAHEDRLTNGRKPTQPVREILGTPRFIHTVPIGRLRRRFHRVLNTGQLFTAPAACARAGGTPAGNRSGARRRRRPAPCSSSPARGPSPPCRPPTPSCPPSAPWLPPLPSARNAGRPSRRPRPSAPPPGPRPSAPAPRC